MSVVKTIHPTYGTQFHLSDIGGNHILAQPPAPGSGTRNLTLSVGGDVLTLSAANIADLQTVLSNFTQNGALT